jgi:hypothetical protein
MMEKDEYRLLARYLARQPIDGESAGRVLGWVNWHWPTSRRQNNLAVSRCGKCTSPARGRKGETVSG